MEPTAKTKITLVQAAFSQLGVQEEPRGSNWGYSVQQYLLSVGITFPAAWCMAFVFWCARKAAASQGVSNPLLKTGSVMIQWRNRPALRVKEPQPGDIFIMDYGKGLGHAGIVEKVDATYIYTIEGNGNDEGSREGFEVCRRRRLRSSILGYLRTGL